MAFLTQIGGSLMSSQFRLCVFFIFSLVVSSMVWGNNPLLEIGFDGDTNEENKVIVIGAGFGSYPEASVSYGDIPTDNGFEGATDGRGMIIHAKPGEGVMVFTQNISTPNCALIRASVRASAPHMTLYLASVDQGESTYVSTLTPNNPASFVGKYNRIADFFVSPSIGLHALLQIINTSETEALTVYVDNFEVLELGEEQIHLSIDDLIAPEKRETLTIPLTHLPTGAKPLEMVYIEPGTFMMGSQSEEVGRDDDEGPQHQVTLTNGFYMGKYEVTQAQWEAVMGSNPSYFSGKPNNPVEQVSWDDCQTFIQILNLLYPEYTFRLPTEAEWEYTCRAGTTTRFYWGEDPNDTQIKDYTWYDSPSGTKEVGGKLPNAWGLYDMSGNVWEWCQDWYGSYGSSSQINPTGPNSGSARINRSGSNSANVVNYRSAYRRPSTVNNRYDNIGFRLVLSLVSEPSDTPFPTPTVTPVPTITPLATSTPIPTSAIPNFPKESEISGNWRGRSIVSSGPNQGFETISVITFHSNKTLEFDDSVFGSVTGTYEYNEQTGRCSCNYSKSGSSPYLGGSYDYKGEVEGSINHNFMFSGKVTETIKAFGRTTITYALIEAIKE
jgi:formylglycine-generating enzyme required for sulfatase activity